LAQIFIALIQKFIALTQGLLLLKYPNFILVFLSKIKLIKKGVDWIFEN
jgi:hypothetical protein